METVYVKTPSAKDLTCSTDELRSSTPGLRSQVNEFCRQLNEQIASTTMVTIVVAPNCDGLCSALILDSMFEQIGVKVIVDIQTIDYSSIRRTAIVPYNDCNCVVFLAAGLVDDYALPPHTFAIGIPALPDSSFSASRTIYAAHNRCMAEACLEIADRFVGPNSNMFVYAAISIMGNHLSLRKFDGNNGYIVRRALEYVRARDLCDSLKELLRFHDSAPYLAATASCFSRAADTVSAWAYMRSSDSFNAIKAFGKNGTEDSVKVSHDLAGICAHGYVDAIDTTLLNADKMAFSSIKSSFPIDNVGAFVASYITDCRKVPTFYYGEIAGATGQYKYVGFLQNYARYPSLYEFVGNVCDDSMGLIYGYNNVVVLCETESEMSDFAAKAINYYQDMPRMYLVREPECADGITVQDRQQMEPLGPGREERMFKICGAVEKVDILEDDCWSAFIGDLEVGIRSFDMTAPEAPEAGHEYEFIGDLTLYVDAGDVHMRLCPCIVSDLE